MKMNQQQQQQQQQIIRRNNISSAARADDNNNSDTEAAATALTALGASIIQHKPENDNEEDGIVDIEIPQRFTKSGRKRAVSFPLKVRHKQTTLFSGT